MTGRPVLVVDNVDSFVHNLARYFERLGQVTVVVRNTTLNDSIVKTTVLPAF